VNHFRPLGLEALPFRRRQPAQRDGVYPIRPFKSHLQSNRPTITEGESSYKSGSLSVGTGIKANVRVSVSDLVRLGGGNLAKEQGHTIPLLARNRNGRSRAALDDDRHLRNEVPVAGALCGPEVTSRAVEADIAHRRRSLTPPPVGVTKDRGITSGEVHSRALRDLIGISGWTLAPRVRSGVTCRCDKCCGEQNRFRILGHSHPH
jgi:hypothetical protein